MKLKSLLLKNFRSYKEQVIIEFDDLTTLIGKNDIGKSTILEALEIFFNGSLVKIESQDSCVYSDSDEVTIGCIFTDLPDEIILDVTSRTNLKDEYLLNQEGFLEIHKIFDCGLKTPKETVYAIAYHPIGENVNDLTTLSNSDLKKRCKDLGIEGDGIDLRSNVSIRKAIWCNSTNLKFDMKRIPLNKEDAKRVWDNLSKEMPTYAFFRADRPSTDDDSEVQDPMKIAVLEAIKSVEREIEVIKEKVKNNAIDVADRTLEKIKEMDAELASELMPSFKSDPKWENLFKLSLTGDDQIPINKRGSGVRRLILLNFFRAEAERRQKHNGTTGIIYAIEEPETSQHPTNQKLIIESLINLSQLDGCQIIITTHVPGLAGFLPLESLRVIEKDENGNKAISYGNDDTYKKIAQMLGIMPDSRVKAFICVEGVNDVSFLKNMSSIINKHHPKIPDLNVEDRIAFILLGGSTLKEWVFKHYLSGLNIPEIHIYDRDIETPPKYQDACNEVNNRCDGSIAFLTTKREMENYIHPDAIYEALGIRISFDENDDVSALLAKTIHEADPASNPWDEIKRERKKEKERIVKKRLNNEVAKFMTIERINIVDTEGEIKNWLETVVKMIE